METDHYLDTGSLFRRSTILKVRYFESPLCRYVPQC